MPLLLPVWLGKFINLNKGVSAKYLSKSRVCNSSNKCLIRVLWPLCTCQAHILTLLQVSNHYSENYMRSCGDMNPLWCVYMAIFLCKSREVCNSSIKNWSEFCDLYAHVQPIFLLCCKFQIIILKTAGEVAETWTLLWHVYKTIFLSICLCWGCTAQPSRPIRVMSSMISLLNHTFSWAGLVL